MFVNNRIVKQKHATFHFEGRPIDVPGVVADEVLEVAEHRHEAVELIRQPEVSETHVMQRRHEDPLL